MDANALNHAFGCGARETQHVPAFGELRAGALVAAGFLDAGGAVGIGRRAAGGGARGDWQATE